MGYLFRIGFMGVGLKGEKLLKVKNREGPGLQHRIRKTFSKEIDFLKIIRIKQSKSWKFRTNTSGKIRTSVDPV